MKARVIVAVKYAFFAAVSIGVNLLSQRGSLAVYSGTGSIYSALAVGTLAGLLVKYLLDKHFIFYHSTACVKEDSCKFFLYSCMGIITTAIFWGTELAFYHLLQFGGAKYVGGATGLIVGYSIKYRLDKRFVFCKTYT